MKLWQYLLVITIALVAGFAGGRINTTADNVTHDTGAYERVLASRTLHCGYAGLQPFMVVSPDGQISGPTYEIMNEIGKRLDIKIDWREETGYGQISESLQSRKIDAFCGVLWATSTRASALLFTRPTHYVPVFPCVAADSTAYDTDTSGLNDPSKTFAAYDGDVSHQLPEVLFPKAKVMSVSPSASAAEWLEQVATHKADAVATCDKIFAADFTRNNPGKIKVAAPDSPLTYVQVAFGVQQNDFALKAMLDQALFEMTADGTLARIMQESLGTQAGELVMPKAF